MLAVQNFHFGGPLWGPCIFLHGEFQLSLSVLVY